MTLADRTFPTAMVANTALSPKPNHCVHTMDTATTPLTRTSMRVIGAVARQSHWKAKAITIDTPMNGYEVPMMRKYCAPTA